MAHQIENMFSVKETPWHKLGKVIQNAPTVEEGIKLAGLDWKVLVKSALYEVPKVTTDALSGENYISNTYENLDNLCKVFVRSDNNSVLGIVGPKTHPLQNTEAFAFFQSFIDANEAKLETAGSLSDGKKVWVMAKIQHDNSVIKPGDEVARYMLLSNSHDGTTAIRVGFTPIRVVCANTLAMAHGDKASKLIRVRHSKDVKKNLENVRETMNVANQEFEATAEQFRFLASRNINQADLTKYVKEVFKMKEKEDTGELATRTQNILDDIIAKHEKRTAMGAELAMMAIHRKETEEKAQANLLENILENFEAGRGSDIKSTRGTWWTAYNAANEYLNYDKGHGDDTRIQSLWFGESEKVNRDALTTAIDMANA